MTNPEPAPQRHVGGLWCREVLHALADFLDGSLPPDHRANVEAHLDGCTWCAQFGGEYAQTVAALQHAGPAPSVPTGLADRLRGRLDQALDSEG